MSTHATEDEFLAAYDPTAYPSFALTVDLAVFTIRNNQLCVLLIERGEQPQRGRWALPGGHVEHGIEDADNAAKRELDEETGLNADAEGVTLEQVRTYSDPRRDPRIRAGLHVASVAYFALAADLPDPQAGTDAAKARYVPVDDLDLATQVDTWNANTGDYTGPGLPLAYDHALILTDALERVRAKLEYTTLALAFVTEPFTLGDLRAVYKAVWGVAPDLGNFRRKVLSTAGFVVEHSKNATVTPTVGRPASTTYRRGTAAWLNPPLMRRDQNPDTH